MKIMQNLFIHNSYVSHTYIMHWKHIGHIQEDVKFLWHSFIHSFEGLYFIRNTFIHVSNMFSMRDIHV
jgi:hypothetical protein